MSEVENARKFTFDVGWATTSLAAMMGVGFILGVLLGNYFDASGLGAYSMVLTIWTIAALTAGLGIPLAVIKYVAQYKDRPRIWNSLVSSAMLSGCLIGLFATAVLYLLSPFVEDIFNIPDLGHLLRIVSFSFPFIVINEVFSGTLNALRKMRNYALLEMFRRGLVLVFTLVFIWMGMGIEGAVVALVLSPLSVTVTMLTIHKKYFRFRFKNFKKYTRRLVGFGGKLYFASSVSLLNAQAATLLIGFYLTDTDVGIYAAALMFFNFMIMVPQAIQKVTYPAFSTHFAKKRKALVVKMMKLIMRFSFILMSLGCLFLIFYIDDIITLIFPGKEAFLLAVNPLKIMAVAGVPFGVIVPVGAIFASAGRADIPLKISVARTVTNIGIAIALIPMTGLALWGFNIGGLNGAALALGGNFIASIFLTFLYLKPCLKIRLKIRRIWIGLMIFFIFLGITVVLSHCANVQENILGLIIIPLYIGVLYGSKILSKDFFTMAKMVIGKRSSAEPR